MSSPERPRSIDTAEVVLPAADLDATLVFFTERLGFRLEQIFPADDPATALISGYGLRVRLEPAATGGPGLLRLLCVEKPASGDRVLTAPNGVRIELVEADPALILPPVEPAFVVTKVAGDGAWTKGRAGMLYRDLIPGRLGGHLVASHIRIPDGGPVPDQVHFHNIHFQMIYCARGWVRVVYEDQGPPLVLQAGDCVLQPPGIRHRVLESAAGLEVIELACPAEHVTCLDHDLALPTDAFVPSRDFGGQRFIHHRAADAAWDPWRLEGFEARDSGIALATEGLAGVKVVRRAGATDPGPCHHDAAVLFAFVLKGRVTLETEGQVPQVLVAGDAVSVPAQLAYRLAAASDDLELLEVTLPAAFVTSVHSDSSFPI